MNRLCRSCPQEHLIYLQATPEYDAPRRETVKDFVLAALTWGMVIAAYALGAYAWWASNV